MNFDSNSAIAVSYSLGKAKTDPFYLNNQNDFKDATLVDTLPVTNQLQLRGESQTIIEVPSSTDYYDGSIQLKSTTVSCKQWMTQKEACMGQKACGWCRSNNSCIAGNSLGPLAPCVRKRFIYSVPKDNWNPFKNDHVNIKRQIIGGVQLTTMSPKKIKSFK